MFFKTNVVLRFTIQIEWRHTMYFECKNTINARHFQPERSSSTLIISRSWLENHLFRVNNQILDLLMVCLRKTGWGKMSAYFRGQFIRVPLTLFFIQKRSVGFPILLKFWQAYMFEACPEIRQLPANNHACPD